MSQFDFGTINPTTKSGTALASDLGNFRDAVNSTHKGPGAPPYARAGLYWIDDTGDPIWVKKVYDGAHWIAVEVIDSTSNVSYPFGANPKLGYLLAGGGANILTLTPSVPVTSYVDMDVMTFEAASGNNGAATLNVSGVGAKAIRKIMWGSDVALAFGDILAKNRYVVVYDAAANSGAGAWILVNPSGGLLPMAFNTDSTTDFNDLTAPGWQPKLYLGSNPHGPGGTPFYYVHNDVYANQTITQRLRAYSSQVEEFTRFRYAGVWGPLVRTMFSTSPEIALGVPKAWATVAPNGSIIDAYNIASVLKNATGNFYATFSNGMADGKYAVTGSVLDGSAFHFNVGGFKDGVGFRFYTYNAANALADPSTEMYFVVHGRLAA